MFLVTGFMRGVGKSLMKIGVLLQGKNAYFDKYKPPINVINFCGKKPNLSELLFHARNASIIGDVTIGEKSSVWYSSVIRGDGASISIGSNTHILDSCVIHINDLTEIVPTIIGNNNIIMPHSILHACTIKDNCYVGAHSILLDNSIMESNSVLLPHSLLTSNKIIKENEMWGGSPAKFIRNIEEEERNKIKLTLEELAETSINHQKEQSKDILEVHIENTIIRLNGELETYHKAFYRRPETDNAEPGYIYDRLPPEMTSQWIVDKPIDPKIKYIDSLSSEEIDELVENQMDNYRTIKHKKE